MLVKKAAKPSVTLSRIRTIPCLYKRLVQEARGVVRHQCLFAHWKTVCCQIYRSRCLPWKQLLFFLWRRHLKMFTIFKKTRKKVQLIDIGAFYKMAIIGYIGRGDGSYDRWNDGTKCLRTWNREFTTKRWKLAVPDLVALCVFIASSSKLQTNAQSFTLP